MTISAIRLKDKDLSRFEICDVTHDWAVENDGRALFTTNTKYAAAKRSEVKQLLLFIDESTGYLVDVVAVGKGYPNSVTRVPAGYTSPPLWAKEERNSWLAIRTNEEGQFDLVNPADYRLDSNPEKTLPEAFTIGQSSHAYVHEA